MKLDSAGLQVLSREECLAMLGSVPIGRIVFTERALPAVQPVRFVLDGTDVVIRTAAGSVPCAATGTTIVAFEADEFDAERCTGWSVTAVGPARTVTDPAERARLARLPLPAWAPDGRDHFIVMRAERLTGRRIPPVAPVTRPA